MSTTAEAATLESLLVEDAAKVRAKLSETLGAITGEDAVCGDEEANVEPVGTLYAATLASPELPGSMTLFVDGRLVATCAGKLAMIADDELNEARATGEVPEGARASIDELFRMLGCAVGELAGGSELMPATAPEEFELERWPQSEGALLLLFNGSEQPIGALALEAAEEVAAADASGGEADPPSEPAGDVSGWTVKIHGWPGDPLHLHLSGILERLGAKVLPFDSTASGGSPATAALVVTRSAADLQIRLDKLTSSESRPSVIVACSDRPTLQLVSIARKHGADDFLVLPGDDETLRAALTRTRNDA